MEVEGTSKIEEVQTEEEQEKLVFELRNDEHDSDESTKSDEEVEQLTPFVRRSERVRKPDERYSSTDFHFAFVLSTTDEELKLAREEVDSTKGKLWKDAMIEEMESFHKNMTGYLVEIPNGRKLLIASGCSITQWCALLWGEIHMH
jgi:hypothetical protein